MKEKKEAIRTVIALITFTVLLIYFVNHAYIFTDIFSKFLSLTFPFLIGCGIAFVVNIPMRGIETHLFKDETKKIYKAKRAISMLLAYIFFFAVVGLVVFVVAPEIAQTLTILKDKLPKFVEDAKNWALGYTKKYPDITEKIKDININWDKITDKFTDNGGNMVVSVISLFSSIISALVNTIIGLVFSMYILASKETLSRQVKMFIYAMFKENTADELMVFGKIANTTFSKFFTCQFREGIILGSMFALSMAVLGMPYPVTVGVLIAFTALIPVFGAFIGLFIGMFLIFVIEPATVGWFVVLFFVLQFIENYFIYPKLVGGDVGLSAIWVLLAVLVGGDLMGIVGMFVFIPLVSVLYAYARSLIYRKLKKRDIDIDQKQAPEHVVPFMEGRRRLFTPKNQGVKADDGSKNDSKKDDTDEKKEGAQ